MNANTACSIMAFLNRVSTTGLQEAEELTRCARVLAGIVAADQAPTQSKPSADQEPVKDAA